MATAQAEISELGYRAWAEEVRALAAECHAVILAHTYQVPWIQEVAHFTGDSLELSRRAAATDAEVIVFCGVHFMAETAKILSPDRTVLIPDVEAGCSLADSITGAQLRAWKAEHPDAVVVETEERRNSVTLRLHVGPSDMGRVIGRRGRVAQAIRSVVRAAGAREGVEATVDIVD